MRVFQGNSKLPLLKTRAEKMLQIINLDLRELKIQTGKMKFRKLFSLSFDVQLKYL